MTFEKVYSIDTGSGGNALDIGSNLPGWHREYLDVLEFSTSQLYTLAAITALAPITDSGSVDIQWKQASNHALDNNITKVDELYKARQQRDLANADEAIAQRRFSQALAIIRSVRQNEIFLAGKGNSLGTPENTVQAMQEARLRSIENQYDRQVSHVLAQMVIARNGQPTSEDLFAIGKALLEISDEERETRQAIIAQAATQEAAEIMEQFSSMDLCNSTYVRPLITPKIDSRKAGVLP